MDQFKQVGKKLRKNQHTTELNTRRIAENFPMIERKNDIISFDSSFSMEFFLSDHPHNVRLNLYLKPPINCFKCQLGAPVNFTEAVATGGTTPPQDGDVHPVPFSGFGSNVGGFALDPSGVIVPSSGYYNVRFGGNIVGVTTVEVAGIVASVRVNGIIVTQKVWSVENGLLNAPLAFISVDVGLIGLCILARQGDIVSAYLSAGGIAFYTLSSSSLTATLIALA